jgi:hypothetical protein
MSEDNPFGQAQRMGERCTRQSVLPQAGSRSGLVCLPLAQAAHRMHSLLLRCSEIPAR